MGITIAAKSGTVLTQLTLQPGYPRVRTGQDGLAEIEYQWKCDRDYSTAASLIDTPHVPAPAGSPGTDPKWGREDYTIDKDGPGFCKITAVYRYKKETTGFGDFESRSWSEEVPLRDDRSPIMHLVAAPDREAACLEQEAKGRTTFPVSSAEWSFTKYYLHPLVSIGSISIAESGPYGPLDGGINQTGNPDGLTGATAANWLMVSREVREIGKYLVAVRRTWRHSPYGWNTDEYATGSTSTTTTTTSTTT